MIDTGFDWTLAPLVWLVLMGGMLLSMQAGHAGACQASPRGAPRLDGLRRRSRGVRAGWVCWMAFTFSGAASRFDHRRDLIVEEANDIGTAYLRIALLPEAARGDHGGSCCAQLSRDSPSVPPRRSIVKRLSRARRSPLKVKPFPESGESPSSCGCERLAMCGRGLGSSNHRTSG